MPFSLCVFYSTYPHWMALWTHMGRDTAAGVTQHEARYWTQCNSKKQRWWFWSDQVWPLCTLQFCWTHLTHHHLSVQMTELQWSFRMNQSSAMQKINAKWQEYCWGEVGGDCHVVLIWFVLLKKTLFTQLELFTKVLGTCNLPSILKVC